MDDKTKKSVRNALIAVALFGIAVAILMVGG